MQKIALGLAMAFELIITIFVLFFLGRVVDNTLLAVEGATSSYKATIVGVFLGLILSTYRLVKSYNRFLNERQDG